MSEKDEIMVSVSCLAYNHEPYIRDCLEGFVNQKANFKFEVLVHDDASTDKTAEIIREYEHKYPDIIKPIYQQNNQYSGEGHISERFQFPRAKGKYIAECEGDDYWCDENKLQKQFDILESHPECSICVHRVRNILADGTDRGDSLPKCELQTGVLNSNQFFDLYFIHYPFQTSSYFYRKSLYEAFYSEKPRFIELFGVGDEPMQLLAITLGKYYYIDEIMSAYRRNSAGSWSNRTKGNMTATIKHRQRIINGLKSYNEYTDYQYADGVEKLIDKNEFAYAQFTKDYKTCLEKKYRYIYHNLPLKERLNIMANAYLPRIMSIYYQLKGLKHE